MLDKFINGIYFGETIHKRFTPKEHFLKYKMFQVLINIDELELGLKNLRLNRFGLFSFYEKDYGPIQKQNTNLAARIRDLMHETCDIKDYKIMLLTMPRVLGFVFNPISIYFIINKNNVIDYAIYEVNNTFGDRHSYIMKTDFDNEYANHKCPKHLHVSPFMQTAKMEYKFKLGQPLQNLNFAITLTNTQENQKYLFASFHANRFELNDTNLLRMFAKIPFETLKVVFAIHFEAVKIISKGIFLKPKPKTPKNGVSVNDNTANALK